MGLGLRAEIMGLRSHIDVCSSVCAEYKRLCGAFSDSSMEVFGKSPMVTSANVIYLSAILGRDTDESHKCDCKCENENVCGNMYRCKLTGLTHVCDYNCNQRILYDNHTSLCRASGRVFPLSPAEEQAVRGVRRKLDSSESVPSSEGCSFKRRRHGSSPFERSFTAVSPICSPAGDGMELS